MAYTDSTLKKLFALSGNQCAFPGCAAPIVDGDSGIIVGEICHIKGKSPNGPRYNKTQAESERNGYDNLLLMCDPHNKIVDHKDTRADYPPERLRRFKSDHEVKFRRTLNGRIITDEYMAHIAAISDDGGARWFAEYLLVDGELMDRFVNHFKNEGDANITTFGQSGGQNAYQITNIYAAPPASSVPTLVPVVKSPMCSPQYPSIDLYDFRVRIRNEGKKAVRNFCLEIEVPNAYASSSASSSKFYVPNHSKSGVTLYRYSSEEHLPGFIIYPLQTADFILMVDYQLRHEQYANVSESITVLCYSEDELVSSTEYPIADFRNKDRMKQLGI